MKKITAPLTAAVCLLAVLGLTLFTTSDRALAANNATCPVTGNVPTDRYTIVHEGKALRLCSPECAATLWTSTAQPKPADSLATPAPLAPTEPRER